MGGDFQWVGNVADVVAGAFFRARVVVRDGCVDCIERLGAVGEGSWLVPGFIDAHLHVESTLMPPSQLARALVPHGTVAALCDPHEIANVMGVAGVRWMLEDAARVPFGFHFGAPSCVPAMPFESAGAVLGPAEVGALLDDPLIGFLSEMMNFPGVVAGDARVMAVLAEALSRRRPIDGHSPGLSGDCLRRYVEAGITTDHECTRLDEAREKAALGMLISIREGSAARNMGELMPLLGERPGSCMLCADDLHPDDIEDRGHIDHMLAMAAAAGMDRMDALRAATLNPVRHYGLKGGLIQPGDLADMVEVADLDSWRVLRTWVGGRLVAEGGRCLFDVPAPSPVNNFAATAPDADAFRIPARGGRVRVIEAVDGQLLTGVSLEEPLLREGFAVADPSRDMLLVAVVSRYAPGAVPALGFVRGFGLREGAIASTIAHDSHNIVAVGADEQSLARAVGLAVRMQGALVCVGGGRELAMPLPIAGLMSDMAWPGASHSYKALTRMARELGSKPSAPFMLLSFLSLPVIPSLKIIDSGLFDVDAFRPTQLWE
jgi:adenine deaminase